MSALQQAVDGEAILAVRDLSFYYGDFRGLNQVSLDILKNKVTAFIGPSGCGKSTCCGPSTACTISIRASARKGRSSSMAVTCWTGSRM
jgi:ABC-type branched-subunit amino acid transport system ATPase component